MCESWVHGWVVPVGQITENTYLAIFGLILAAVFVWTLSSWLSYICGTDIWEYRLICISIDIGCSICVNPEFLIELTWIDTGLKAVLVVGRLLQTQHIYYIYCAFKTRWILKMRDLNCMYLELVGSCKWEISTIWIQCIFELVGSWKWEISTKCIRCILELVEWWKWEISTICIRCILELVGSWKWEISTICIQCILERWIIKMRDFNYMTWNLYNLSWFPVDTGGI